MKRLLILAFSVLALCASQTGLQAQGKTMHATGTVKTVSDTSLTITASGGTETTFTMDATTKFKGKGLGTKSATGKLTPSDAVAMGDRVTVDYSEMSGAMHASMVSVTHKAASMKK